MQFPPSSVDPKSVNEWALPQWCKIKMSALSDFPQILSLRLWKEWRISRPLSVSHCQGSKLSWLIFPLMPYYWFPTWEPTNTILQYCEDNFHRIFIAKWKFPGPWMADKSLLILLAKARSLVTCQRCDVRSYFSCFQRWEIKKKWSQHEDTPVSQLETRIAQLKGRLLSNRWLVGKSREVRIEQ